MTALSAKQREALEEWRALPEFARRFIMCNLDTAVSDMHPQGAALLDAGEATRRLLLALATPKEGK